MEMENGIFGIVSVLLIFWLLLIIALSTYLPSLPAMTKRVPGVPTKIHHDDWIVRFATAAPNYTDQTPVPIEIVPSNNTDQLYSKGLRGETIEIELHPNVKVEAFISRQSTVEAICDARGNLGPCSVVIQDPPGQDWLKDRWQAASDMGGTAIPGAHWIVLDFHRLVQVTKVVIDWETAHADAYLIQSRQNLSSSENISHCGWDFVFDNRVPPESNRLV